ncbi:adenylyltransferase/cytidyltransferase family protein [Streptomyces sp. NPDC002812]|uniref:adenylyltransferase/cytidyltransferase family protein n=1 Tax=unclassified Streptomyces TaxID=2593676 RepID=UPI00202E305D|nr:MULTISPECIES: adenylyltransferase/cytidyltransferase family protein [unclassified Streptomyces]MCM1969009.1 adenylyltransferase/cytidyltransferase family protein [Streptomyces sp. G1]MCX5124573.1 adenylyltransferase/cytidyltransferase family protein [Streptomyces sp. NBC_00347]MCX5297816.1 adenylyltransferase/cytidyltransferase family protein [Streptomyces sp. NBC_00193]
MSQLIGYASGVFDLFHIGHLNLLKQARAQCDYLVAGVLTDEASCHKGFPPAIPLHERIEVVRSMSCVDEAIVDPTLENLDAWQQIGFHRLFKGDDWRGTPRAARWESDFTTLGVEVIYLPNTPHAPSTNLHRLINHL